MWRTIKQKCNATSASFVTAMYAISMIVTSLVQSCLFLTLVSWATASGWRRKQLGEDGQLHRRMLSDGIM